MDYRCLPNLQFFFAQVAEIVKEWNTILRTGYDAKETKANAQRFSKYGDYIYFEILTDGNLLSYKEVEEMPVSIALTKLMYEKDKADYQKDLRRVYEREMKQKNDKRNIHKSSRRA
ncbi:MAG: class I SAM-dependent methyltransferase [Crocosphaera sp.]|nr:class I SAM-dependent methyltransferase [Crocosphaera sp.]